MFALSTIFVKPMPMKEENIELYNKIVTGIRKAHRQLLETSAEKNESLVISGPNGEVLVVPAKQLLWEREQQFTDLVSQAFPF